MRVSRDWETFCSGQGSRPDSSVPSMINMDPPLHNLRRRIISAGFTPRRVENHEPYLRRKVEVLEIDLEETSFRLLETLTVERVGGSEPAPEPTGGLTPQEA